MQLPSAARAEAAAHLKTAQDKLHILSQIDPLLIDVSLREPCFASVIGHTLQNKLELLPLVEQFGHTDKIIATLDYQFAEHATQRSWRRCCSGPPTSVTLG